MQKIILFIEPNEAAFFTPAKIGDMFMNRFSIDENASCEILKRFDLGKTSLKMLWYKRPYTHGDYKNFVEEREQKGVDHFILIVNNAIHKKCCEKGALLRKGSDKI